MDAAKNQRFSGGNIYSFKYIKWQDIWTLLVTYRKVPLLQPGSDLVLENWLCFCTFCRWYDKSQCEWNKINPCKIFKNTHTMMTDHQFSWCSTTDSYNSNATRPVITLPLKYYSIINPVSWFFLQETFLQSMVPYSKSQAYFIQNLMKFYNKDVA